MTETKLYNGLHTITFQKKTHKYNVDGMPVKGVTSIMDEVLAKNGLMLWPLNVAMDYLSMCIEDGGIEKDDLKVASKHHETLRNNGSSTGTTVHKLAESVLRGEKIDLLDYPEEVIKAISGFEEWLASHAGVDVLDVERIVYSKDRDYVGTLDSILRINGKNYLCDLKTTNASKDAPKGVYSENFIQLGAYAKAYTEEFPAKIDDLMVISCKKNGKVDTVKASDLGFSVQDCIDLWVNLHNLYIGLRKLKSKLGVK